MTLIFKQNVSENIDLPKTIISYDNTTKDVLFS